MNSFEKDRTACRKRSRIMKAFSKGCTKVQLDVPKY